MSRQESDAASVNHLIGDLAPLPRAAVIVSVIPDGSVLLSTETEQYFGLNKTGTFIWQHLYPTCETIAQICTKLEAQFPGGTHEQVARDVQRLLTRLCEKQLVDPRTET
jgi:hypothetical protein